MCKLTTAQRFSSGSSGFVIRKENLIFVFGNSTSISFTMINITEKSYRKPELKEITLFTSHALLVESPTTSTDTIDGGAHGDKEGETDL